MVIHDFHFIGVTIGPDKTDTPLIVYPDAVLALAFTFQGFETVGRWNAQIIKGFGVIQHTQFSTCNSLNIIGQPILGQAPGPFPSVAGTGGVALQ